MKHYFLEGEHLVPLIAAHRQFLQQGYDKGRFLVSGPSIPPTGGVLIARAESIEELNAFLADEPFCKAKVMRFCKIIEPSDGAGGDVSASDGAGVRCVSFRLGLARADGADRGRLRELR
jgi:uncharacterized protein YciI